MLLQNLKIFLESCFNGIIIETLNDGIVVRNYIQLHEREKLFLKELIPKKFEYVANKHGLEIWEMF